MWSIHVEPTTPTPSDRPTDLPAPRRTSVRVCATHTSANTHSFVWHAEFRAAAQILNWPQWSQSQIAGFPASNSFCKHIFRADTKLLRCARVSGNSNTSSASGRASDGVWRLLERMTFVRGWHATFSPPQHTVLVGGVGMGEVFLVRAQSQLHFPVRWFGGPSS